MLIIYVMFQIFWEIKKIIKGTQKTNKQMWFIMNSLLLITTFQYLSNKSQSWNIMFPSTLSNDKLAIVT